MDVMVVESEPGAAASAVGDLEAAGHRVTRCHEPGQPAFPCAGLTGACPVEADTVDVVLTVRGHVSKRPAPLEDGVVCALRRRVPVVVAGSTLFNPFEESGATVVGDADVVTACEQVANAPRDEHTAIATAALRASLEHAGVEDVEAATATVHRRQGQLLVSLRVPGEVESQVRSTAAVRVLGALHAFDPSARGIDIAGEPTG
jgi:hypothetical protein